MVEQYRLAKINKIEAFSLVLQKAMEELKKRDFSEVGTKDLLSVISALESKLKMELKPIEYHTDRYHDFFEEEDRITRKQRNRIYEILPLRYPAFEQFERFLHERFA